ncbi:mitochondrial 37S ribosomal protein mS23 NDAI_0B03540 [Naumovozyma dairenensis CBS 421]|uniref:37S ribosomal protein S25, mitochondrial n=1 Tax=Naumovozyma dairenensis (strain ATCC 10597 / BCRC 20456 / CBS 421 / NBRC 0211 / NRRL Y-12639) TaxID=1071378 RepID=G0W6H7_NAUDC|nr:hypothetical protein NDAI_0B03540 [Naumovozyma dairenensis CBS 421]CCD23388.1 hypothetical protein NDAI_0B03540 [Naumovozyma dairenensis CBS 421]
MKIQTNAVNLVERTSAYLSSGLLQNTPAWYDVVASIPPTKKFTREPKITNPTTGRNKTFFKDDRIRVNNKGLYKTRMNQMDRKDSANNLYKPPKLIYLEDRLRSLFFEQHPWELSRPKILIENSLEENFDWSHIQQWEKQLDGESVVQRTLYLLKNEPGINMLQAYNKARFEFYRLRIQQDISQQVAQEEAEMFGSIFRQTSFEHGIEKEQKVIEQWKKKAIQETQLMEVRSSNPSDSWAAPEEQDLEEDFTEGEPEILDI